MLVDCLYRPGTSVYSFSPVEPLLASAGVARLQNSTGATADLHGHLVLFDIPSGETRGYIIGDRKSQSSAIAWSNDGKRIATGNRRGYVNAFDIHSETVQFDRDVMNDTVSALCWSGDHRRIACGDRSGLVLLIDSETGEEVIEIGKYDAEVLDLRFSPSGRKLAGYFADGRLRIWDAGPGYRYAESDEFRFTILSLQRDELMEAKDYASAVHMQKQLLELRPSDGSLIGQFLLCYSHLDDMESLAQGYRRFFEALNEPSYVHRYWLALTQVSNGELGEYSSTCQAVVDQVDGPTSVKDRMWAVWSSVLAPNALEDYVKVIQLARGLFEEHPDSTQYQQYLGAILLRSGKPKEAVMHLTKTVNVVVENSSSTYGMYFLSIAYQDLGDTDQARQWLDRANVAAEQELSADSVAWNRKLTLELFREEATSNMKASELVDGE